MTVLEATGIRKEFGTLVAVNDVALSVEPGQVVGLIGPNGAGKTTLLRMLATLLRPTRGHIRVLGLDTATDYLKIRRRIGYLPDFFNLYNDLTARECLSFFAKAYGVDTVRIPARVDAVLESADLRDKADDFVRHLSRGMVQRMGLAVLMVHEPELFLLDEPASGLDPIARVQLRHILRRLSGEGKTIIISSHILTELSDFCTHMAIMNKGVLTLYGDVKEIQRRSAGGRRVRVSVLDDADRAADIIRGLAGCRVLAVRDRTLTAEVDGDEARLAALNAELVNRGLKVVAFAEEKTSLEDVFLKVSGGGPESC